MEVIVNGVIQGTIINGYDINGVQLVDVNGATIQFTNIIDAVNSILNIDTFNFD